jgi:hypothetical protein
MYQVYNIEGDLQGEFKKLADALKFVECLAKVDWFGKLVYASE